MEKKSFLKQIRKTVTCAALIALGSSSFAAGHGNGNLFSQKISRTERISYVAEITDDFINLLRTETNQVPGKFDQALAQFGKDYGKTAFYEILNTASSNGKTSDALTELIKQAPEKDAYRESWKQLFNEVQKISRKHEMETRRGPTLHIPERPDDHAYWSR